MGKIVIAYKILPSESTVDLDVLLEKLKAELAEVAAIQRTEKEPIAFGLCALKVTMVLAEKEGILDETEDKIKSIEEVGQLQVLGMTRL
ncbi:MAG: elongation factor 1-beta [Candidatus Bathyarchaeota archaeon]|nr:elongation factor 1-beta [Candidatus Bathyarchaeota archaeon]